MSTDKMTGRITRVVFDKGFGYGRIGIALRIKTHAVSNFLKANGKTRPRASTLPASLKVK